MFGLPKTAGSKLSTGPAENCSFGFLFNSSSSFCSRFVAAIAPKPCTTPLRLLDPEALSHHKSWHVKTAWNSQKARVWQDLEEQALQVQTQARYLQSMKRWRMSVHCSTSGKGKSSRPSSSHDFAAKDANLRRSFELHNGKDRSWLPAPHNLSRGWMDPTEAQILSDSIPWAYPLSIRHQNLGLRLGSLPGNPSNLDSACVLQLQQRHLPSHPGCPPCSEAHESLHLQLNVVEMFRLAIPTHPREFNHHHHHRHRHRHHHHHHHHCHII